MNYRKTLTLFDGAKQKHQIRIKNLILEWIQINFTDRYEDMNICKAAKPNLSVWKNKQQQKKLPKMVFATWFL